MMDEHKVADPFSKEVPELLQEHFKQLHERSGISVEVIKARGYCSILGAKKLEELKFSRSQRRFTGLLVPIHGPDGKPAGFQYKPDKPRSDNRDRPVKYESIPESTNRIDCPPSCQKSLADPSIPLWVTEGCKKADSLASRGECVIDIPGVWNFKSKNELGGVTVSADLDSIAWNGRIVHLCFDSDFRTNSSVQQALQRLSEHLKRRGAQISVVSLPQEGTAKVGVDDYLVAGHTVNELVSLTVTHIEPAEVKEKESLAAYLTLQGQLYLEVRLADGGYSFAHLVDGRVILTPEIKAGGLIVRPRPLPMRENQPLPLVGLPSEDVRAAPLLSPEEMFAKVRSHIGCYADLEPLDLELCTYYVLFTWLYPKVKTLGYLRFKADTGKGKTRVKNVTSDVSFYPLQASGASSFSGMARMQEKWRGTLVVDEADFSGDKDHQISKYLNLGFERGQYYILSDKLNPKQQEFFDPFCPKILAMREPFTDNATEGRLLSITMHETQKDSIPIILPPEYEVETQKLRDELARFTLEHWAEVDGSKMLSFDDLGIEPRLRQLAMPLSVVFQLWPQGVDGFRSYLKQRQKDIRRTRSQSWEGSLVNLVIAIATGDHNLKSEWVEYYEPSSGKPQAVTSSMVARQMNTSTKSVTQALASVGIEAERRYVTLYSEKGEVPKQVRAYSILNSQAWSEIMSRYWPSEDDGFPEIPNALKSAKFVSGELSHPSQVSCGPARQLGLEQNDKTDKTDKTGETTRPAENHREDHHEVEAILGMSIEAAVACWESRGCPVILLGPGQNTGQRTGDLLKVLKAWPMNMNHIEAVAKWLRGNETTDI
jgi:hypothetical protein